MGTTETRCTLDGWTLGGTRSFRNGDAAVGQLAAFVTTLHRKTPARRTQRQQRRAAARRPLPFDSCVIALALSLFYHAYTFVLAVIPIGSRVGTPRAARTIERRRITDEATDDLLRTHTGECHCYIFFLTTRIVITLGDASLGTPPFRTLRREFYLKAKSRLGFSFQTTSSR